MPNLDFILSEISKLSSSDRLKLLSSLQEGSKDKGLLSVLTQEQVRDKAAQCGHCASKQVRGHGQQKGVQRLYCKDCERTSSLLKGSAPYWIHKKDKWEAYVRCMEDGLSLRKSASRVGISYQTAFNWRHKILQSLSGGIPEQFGGIVESDEMYIHYSEKGNKHKKRSRKRGRPARRASDKVAVIAVADRKGKVLLQVAGRKGLRKEAVDKALKERIVPGSILCTDGHTSYLSFALNNDVEHKKIVSRRRGRTLKNKAYHIQTINGLHKQTRDWLRKFNGVSTKYLQNYMYWFMQHKHLKDHNNPINAWISTSIISRSAWKDFHTLRNNTVF